MITKIRATHPAGFRSGQWATFLGAILFHGHWCYVIEFEDGVIDHWRVVDSLEPYEFTEEAT